MGINHILRSQVLNAVYFCNFYFFLTSIFETFVHGVAVVILLGMYTKIPIHCHAEHSCKQFELIRNNNLTIEKLNIMKRILLFFLVLGVLFSCNKDKEPENKLIGDWKLIEVLADPGDGSGTFNAVQSNKIIRFENDGIITSNGNLCDMSINSDNATSGTYSITDMTLNSPDCSYPDYGITFDVNGNTLMINYPCIEPCIAKYEKQ